MKKQKRVKGVPVCRDEVKERHLIMLTPFAWKVLSGEAKTERSSCSELIEQMIRDKYMAE